MKSALSDDLFDLAVACRVIALYGHEDKTLGHLSWRDPGGRGVWIKSAHKGLAEIKSSEDFVLIDMDGKIANQVVNMGIMDRRDQSVYLDWLS